MKLRALGYAGVVLGVVLMMSSYAVPVASAAGGTAMITSVGCPANHGGDLGVTYEYSGFPGSVRTVDFHVANVVAGDQQAAVKGGTGPQGGVTAFFAPNGTSPFDWGQVTVQLLGNSGKVIQGSTIMSTPVPC
jgi:hypothetical protein